MTRRPAFPELAMFAILALAFLSSTMASAETIDQANDDFGPAGNGNVAGAAKGQSFLPALAAIDFMDFTMTSMSGMADPPPSTYVLDLWRWPVTDGLPPYEPVPPLLLATSDPVEASGTEELVYRFRFVPTVSLTPGVLHWVLFRRTDGVNAYGIRIGHVPSGNGYERGALISDFESFGTNYDAWFREGIVETDATASSWGRIKNAYR